MSARVKHRNPLFQRQLGLSLSSLGLDVLHLLYLGVFADYVGAVLWAFLLCAAWCRNTSLGIIRIRDCLGDWYAGPAKVKFGNKLTTVGYLTVQMLGKRSNPCCKAKAAETGYLMHFCVHLLERFWGVLGEKHTAFAEAGLALERYLAVLHREGKQVSAAGQQVLWSTMLRHLTLCPVCDISYKPKHHLWIHMTSRVPRTGNPVLQATWLDESGNRTLRNITQGCHRVTWERTVFFKWKRLALRGFHGMRAL